VVNASVGYGLARVDGHALGEEPLQRDLRQARVFLRQCGSDYIETRYEDRADPRQLGVTAAYRF